MRPPYFSRTSHPEEHMQQYSIGNAVTPKAALLPKVKYPDSDERMRKIALIFCYWLILTKAMVI